MFNDTSGAHNHFHLEFDMEVIWVLVYVGNEQNKEEHRKDCTHVSWPKGDFPPKSSETERLLGTWSNIFNPAV